jgi:hypothetical protein
MERPRHCQHQPLRLLLRQQHLRRLWQSLSTTPQQPLCMSWDLCQNQDSFSKQHIHLVNRH